MSDTVTSGYIGRKYIFYSDRVEVIKKKTSELLRTVSYTDMENMCYCPKFPLLKTMAYNILYDGSYGSYILRIHLKNRKEMDITVKVFEGEFEKIRGLVGESTKIMVPEGKKWVQLHKDSDF